MRTNADSLVFSLRSLTARPVLALLCAFAGPVWCTARGHLSEQQFLASPMGGITSAMGINSLADDCEPAKCTGEQPGGGFECFPALAAASQRFLCDAKYLTLLRGAR